MECKKDNQGMYDLYEEYKATLKACKKPLRKRQNMNRDIREKYVEPHKRRDHKANVNDITQWNSMVGELEEDIKSIEEYLDFNDRYYMHKEYNNIKSMILNPNSDEGEISLNYELATQVADDIADTVCDVELQDEVIDTMEETLTERQKQVVNLYFWEDKTQDQIADILGIAQKNVSTNLQKALKMLQSRVKIEDFR